MPNAARLPRLLLLATLSSAAPLAAAACGPSLHSLARDTFFVGYDCAKNQITVKGTGGEAYEATGCGRHALYHCRNQNGGMACEEILPPGAGIASASPSTAPAASAVASSSVAPPPASAAAPPPAAPSGAPSTTPSSASAVPSAHP